VPKRLALRMRLVDSLAEWRQVPELVEVRKLLCRWYRSLRLVERGPDVGLKQFTEVIRVIRAEGKNTVALAAAGIHKLQAKTGSKYSSEFLDRWLDGFLLSRIGSNMLLDQYMACASKEDGGLAKSTGIVNPKTDVLAICRQSSAYASKVCLHYCGSAPTCIVENYREDMRGPQPDHPCSFSYIPGFLRYIMIELLKNSFKATVKYADSADDLRHRPVQVLVSCDEAHVAIRVSDRAGGIPSHVGDRIWSYLNGAAATGEQGSEPATPLSGYGVGLPLSRLHARYLGGSLDVKTFPGFGTDAWLMLPRLHKHQVEAVPPERVDAEALLRKLHPH